MSSKSQPVYLFTSEKCYICQKEFVEGSEVFSMFQRRLRDDGQTDDPLSSIMSTVLGDELEEADCESSIICESCNELLLQFESARKRSRSSTNKISGANGTAGQQNVSAMSSKTYGDNITTFTEEVDVSAMQPLGLPQLSEEFDQDGKPFLYSQVRIQNETIGDLLEGAVGWNGDPISKDVLDVDDCSNLGTIQHETVGDVLEGAVGWNGDPISEDVPDLDDCRNQDSNPAIYHQQDDTFICLLCEDEEPMRIIMFMQHMRQEHKVILHSCEQCPGKVILEQELQAHYEDVHNRSDTVTEKTQYQCSMCGKYCATKYTLQNHEKTHYQRSRAYKCHECNKTYMTYQSLVRHKHMHAQMSFCQICSKGFSLQSDLDTHMQLHIKGNAFECGICRKTFLHEADLRSHERLHTGEKPFKCDLCSASFAQRSNLLTHRSSVHRKRFLCQLCGLFFGRRKLLQQHIAATHSIEYPYDCPMCAERFASAEEQKEHMKKHTDNFDEFVYE